MGFKLEVRSGSVQAKTPCKRADAWSKCTQQRRSVYVTAVQCCRTKVREGRQTEELQLCIIRLGIRVRARVSISAGHGAVIGDQHLVRVLLSAPLEIQYHSECLCQHRSNHATLSCVPKPSLGKTGRLHNTAWLSGADRGLGPRRPEWCRSSTVPPSPSCWDEESQGWLPCCSTSAWLTCPVSAALQKRFKIQQLICFVLLTRC